MSTYTPPFPSHVCVKCGALWKFHEDFPEHAPGSWQLVSDWCGPCCDNVTMGDQIMSLESKG
jgi:hypothetical protein